MLGDLNFSTAQGLEFGECGEEVELGGRVSGGDFGTDVGVDLDGIGIAVVANFTKQFERVGRQRVELLAADVGPQPVVALHQLGHTNGQGQQSQRADHEVTQQRAAFVTRLPMSPADEHHGQVNHHDGQHDKVGCPTQANDAPLEIAELFQRAPATDRLGGGRVLYEPVGHAKQRQWQVEQRAQDESDGEIVGQKRRHHADRDHRRADEPVADIRASEQPRVGIPQAVPEHQKDGEGGEQERDGKNRHTCQVLAQDNVEIAGRDGQQQFIRA